MKSVSVLVGGFLVAFTASVATAGFVVEDAPEWRGDANTMYGSWESFTSPNYAPNFAQGGNIGAFGTIHNMSGTGIITGSGNIYDPAGALKMHHYVQNATNDITDAVFNVATMGTGLDWNSLMFTWSGADGSSGMLDASDYSINFENEIPGFGTTYNISWSFDLSAIDAVVTDVAFIFNAIGPHMSYDAGTMDIRMVPAPGALALLGLAGLAGRRRRR